MSNWQIGQTVQVGFMNVVVKKELLDSVYIVANRAGTQLYKFIPHNGIHKLTIAEAKNLIHMDDNRKITRATSVEAFHARRAEVDAVFA